MKVIVNNNTIEVTCQHCKSLLAVTVADIKDVMTVGTYVVCAACQTKVPLSLSEIPKHWRNELDWDE